MDRKKKIIYSSLFAIALAVLNWLSLVLIINPGRYSNNENNENKDTDRLYIDKFEWYGHMGCPWCKKTKEMFETEKIDAHFHDTRTPEGKEAAQKIGLTGGVPFIRNLTTNKETRGFPGSYESLLEKTKL